RAERLAAWGEVARRVAHEIKNPLTPIRLAAERMRRRYRLDAAAASEAVEESVATIVREVVSLTSLVDEFSRFARLPEVRPRPGDVGRVVADAVVLHREAKPGITIRTELEADLPPHQIDDEAMRRCVINLLDNAVAAIDGRDASGEIVVRTSWNANLGCVSLEVEDDGVGLSETDRGRLFLPTFSRTPGGTGLGLAIVHRIVTEHGGRIRAEERAGGGTRIVVELPASVIQSAAPPRSLES
ncbi:MAG: ATP-binding protein, partial [Acidobacteriota bacterium]|nr:ATP-binding protein [Acidobacteriota bacterium]